MHYSFNLKTIEFGNVNGTMQICQNHSDVSIVYMDVADFDILYISDLFEWSVNLAIPFGIMVYCNSRIILKVCNWY